MGLKEKIKDLKDSDGFTGRVIYNSLRAVWLLLRLVKDGRFRSEYFAHRKSGMDYHQRAVFTVEDRYPLVFAACKKYLSTINNPKILSFGCSTGEEVVTISKYMPNAVIMGVDINEWCIKQCRKKDMNSNHSFFYRFSKEFVASGDFDAIFCMAVFQRTENRLNADNTTAYGLTFEQFEQEILLLDNKLKRGGLFIIDNADFAFADTICSGNYKPLDFENNKLPRNRPLFDKNNIKISDTQNNYRVFIKE